MGFHIKNIAIHNSGGLEGNPKASTANHTLADIDRAHHTRWPDFKSELGYWIGYNIVIFPNGTYTQTRLIGEETAAQRGNNFDTISICLVGNFTKGADSPTSQQQSILKAMVADMLEGKFDRWGLKVKQATTFDLSVSRIYPHRVLQPTTSCYGSGLDDMWARNLVRSFIGLQITFLEQFVELYGRMISRKRQLLAGPKFDCMSGARG
jgi:hypothetical protein